MAIDRIHSNQNPKISVNKLGEYMCADPLRRRQIVKDAKAPKTYITTRYSEVRTVLSDYFKSGFDKKFIIEGKSLISQKEEDTKWIKDDNGNSMLALESLEEADLPDFKNYEIVAFSLEKKRITLSGCGVSINPDLLIKNLENGKIGAIKFHVGKGKPLTEDEQIYVATMIKYYLLHLGYEESSIDDGACMSFDVFGQTYESSPKAYKRKINRVEASCEEFVLRWNSL